MVWRFAEGASTVLAGRGIALALAALLGGALPGLSGEPPAAAKATAEVATSSGGGGFLEGLPLSASSDEPIVIESAELEFDYQQNRVFYRGDVRARQADVTIDCQELIVVFDRADDVRKAELRAIIASGDVVITQGGRRATAGKAVFNQVAREITLIENPVLRDGPNEVRGERLTVYLDQGRSVMESSKKERVSAVLYPGEDRPGRRSEQR